MKQITLTLVSLFFAATTFGRSIQMNTDTVTLEDDTRVLAITLQGEHAVTCPGSLDLNGYVGYRNFQTKDAWGRITLDDDYRRGIETVLGRISEEAQKEYFDSYKKDPIYKCLSFGVESGTVYMNVEHIEAKDDEVFLTFPAGYKILEVKQLK